MESPFKDINRAYLLGGHGWMVSDLPLVVGEEAKRRAGEGHTDLVFALCGPDGLKELRPEDIPRYKAAAVVVAARIHLFIGSMAIVPRSEEGVKARFERLPGGRWYFIYPDGDLVSYPRSAVDTPDTTHTMDTVLYPDPQHTNTGTPPSGQAAVSPVGPALGRPALQGFQGPERGVADTPEPGAQATGMPLGVRAFTGVEERVLRVMTGLPEQAAGGVWVGNQPLSGPVP
jgi:hypothetical protein